MKDPALAALWQQNPMLVRLLGLSPLLAVSHSLVTALGLGLATLVVATLGATLLAPLRSRLSPPLLLPAVLLVVATLTAAIDLWMRGFCYSLHQALGLYVPLIAVNGAVLLLGIDSEPRPVTRTARDGVGVGLGMLLALVLLGAARELAGQGTLFTRLDLLLGPRAAGWELHLLPSGYEFPFWALPAGGFVAAGFLLALHRRLAAGRSESTPITPAIRARVTPASRPAGENEED